MGQPITVNVGPLVTADADGIALSQTAAGAQKLAINGAFADEDANNIAESQTPGGAGNLTLDGDLVDADGIAQIGSPRPVYITSAGDDSGITFTITGMAWDANGIYGVVETVTGADTSTVSTTASFATVSQIAVSGAAAAAVTVGTNGVATLDEPRKVIITSADDDTGITFTVVGADGSGFSQTEVVTGANTGAASTILDFQTVESVTTSGATTAGVQVGTNGVSASRWVRFDDYAGNAPVAIQATVSGTVNYTIQTTLQDPDDAVSPVDPADVTWINSTDSNVVSATANQVSSFAIKPTFARVVLNSGSGSVSTVFNQVFTGV